MALATRFGNVRDENDEENDDEVSTTIIACDLKIEGDTPLQRMRNFCDLLEYVHSYNFVHFRNGVLCELTVFSWKEQYEARREDPRIQIYGKFRFIEMDQTIEDLGERIRSCKSIAKDTLAAIFLQEVGLPIKDVENEPQIDPQPDSENNGPFIDPEHIFPGVAEKINSLFKLLAGDGIPDFPENIPEPEKN